MLSTRQQVKQWLHVNVPWLGSRDFPFVGAATTFIGRAFAGLSC
jgi:hypothetical protein